LFDIDGTLLLSGGAGRRALVRVMSDTVADPDIFGRIRFDGKTDPQIIVELLQEAGHERSGEQELIQALSDQYLELLESELVAENAPPPTLMPGVTPLLDALHQDERATLGLLTGNLARGAALKLQSVGLDPERFLVGAFGSDSSHRPDLPAIAADRAQPHFGRVPSGHDVVIIGDTPADVTCGQAIGAKAIAVATGNYPADDLRNAGAYLVVDDLMETQRIIDVIFD
jgi:phosphoglycolate phosphatase